MYYTYFHLLGNGTNMAFTIKEGHITYIIFLICLCLWFSSLMPLYKMSPHKLLLLGHFMLWCSSIIIITITTTIDLDALFIFPTFDIFLYFKSFRDACFIIEITHH